MVLTRDYRSRGICSSVNTPACSTLKVTGVDGESEIQSSTSASENHQRSVCVCYCGPEGLERSENVSYFVVVINVEV